MLHIDYSSYPRMVKLLDSMPYPAARFNLGYRLYQLITWAREVHTDAAATVALANELRTDLNTGGDLFLLLTELYDRLHTTGDYQVLISALRALFITGGDLQARITDLEDKAFNVMDCNPGWQQDTIAPTDFQNANAIYANVNGEQAAIEESTLGTELRARLHTAGDYQVLISALRGELIAAGQIAERLQDLEDKAYNQILTDPGLQEDVGVATNFENLNQIDGIVNGLYYANLVAAGALNATPVGWDTGAGQTRLVTLSVNNVGTLTQTVSAIDAAIAPRPPSGEMPIGIAHVPQNFVSGVSQIVAGGVTFTDGFPRRLAVHTPIATADVLAIAAAAPTAPLVAAANAETPVGWDTGAAETRLVTLSVNAAGVITQTVSAVDAVIAPRPPSGECPIGVVAVPNNFTSGVSATGLCTFTDGFPRRLAVHTPIATADVLPIAASTPGALTAPAATAVSATVPDAFPTTDQ